LIAELEREPQLIEKMVRKAELEVEKLDQEPWKLYGLALIIELLGLLGRYDDASKIVLDILSYKYRGVDAAEKYKTMIYSAILGYPPKELSELLRLILEKIDVDPYAASESLTGFVELAPHSYLVDEDLLSSLAGLVETILEKSIKNGLNIDVLERIHSNVSVFLSELMERCREIHDYRPCMKIKKRGKIFGYLETIGGEILRSRRK